MNSQCINVATFAKGRRKESDHQECRSECRSAVDAPHFNSGPSFGDTPGIAASLGAYPDRGQTRWELRPEGFLGLSEDAHVTLLLRDAGSKILTLQVWVAPRSVNATSKAALVPRWLHRYSPSRNYRHSLPAERRFRQVRQAVRVGQVPSYSQSACISRIAPRH